MRRQNRLGARVRYVLATRMLLLCYILKQYKSSFFSRFGLKFSGPYPN